MEKTGESLGERENKDEVERYVNENGQEETEMDVVRSFENNHIFPKYVWPDFQENVEPINMIV